MIEKHLTIKREHTRDYEIVTREVMINTIKLFGFTISKRSSIVINNNLNGTAKKAIGLRQPKDEKPD